MEQFERNMITFKTKKEDDNFFYLKNQIFEQKISFENYVNWK